MALRFGTMTVLAGAVRTTPRGCSAGEARGATPCCPDNSRISDISDLGVTGRDNVVGASGDDASGDAVAGELPDGSRGDTPVTGTLGCVVADGEMIWPGTASPKISDVLAKPVKFGGVGGSAKNAGFASGMVTGDATRNGLYSGIGGTVCSNVESTGIAA